MTTKKEARNKLSMANKIIFSLFVKKKELLMKNYHRDVEEYTNCDNFKDQIKNNTKKVS